MISEGERKTYLALYLGKEGLHVREICRVAKLTLPAVAGHINKGEKEGMISCEKRGQLKICRLNFESPRLVPVIQDVELARFQQLPHAVQDSFDSFMADLKEKPLIALIFGSFAKRSHDKKSDLDVLLVFQRIDLKLIKGVELSAAKIIGRTGVNIQPVSLDYEEFERGMADSGNNFMKEVKNDALVLHGLDAYLKLMGRFYA
jgi:hypothetical protein